MLVKHWMFSSQCVENLCHQLAYQLRLLLYEFLSWRQNCFLLTFTSLHKSVSVFKINMLLSFRYSSHWFYDSVSGHSSFTAQALSSFHTWRKKVNQSKMLRWIAVACFNSCSFLVPINKLEESVCNVTVKYVGKPRCVESWALCNFGVSMISILAQQ